MATHAGLQNSYAPEVAAVEYARHIPPQSAHADATQGQPHTGCRFQSHSALQHGVESLRQSPDGNLRHPPATEANEKKRVIGLPVLTFWLLAVLGCLVVLGLALGVGLAVGLHNKDGASVSTADISSQTTLSAVTPTPTPTPPNATWPVTSSPAFTSTSTSTSTSSSTTSSTRSAVTSGITGLADNSCTSTQPSTYFAPDGTTFMRYCATDWPNGDYAADGSGAKLKDIAHTTVYTFEDCMQYCLSYNAQLSGSATKCAALTYNSNLTSIIAVGKQGGNCFLKDTKGVSLQGSAESACAAIIF